MHYCCLPYLYTSCSHSFMSYKVSWRCDGSVQLIINITPFFFFQSAIFNFQSLLTVILLLICTCAYIRALMPTLLDKNKTGSVPETHFYTHTLLSASLFAACPVVFCLRPTPLNPNSIKISTADFFFFYHLPNLNISSKSESFWKFFCVISPRTTPFFFLKRISHILNLSCPTLTSNHFSKRLFYSRLLVLRPRKHDLHLTVELEWLWFQFQTPGRRFFQRAGWPRWGLDYSLGDSVTSGYNDILLFCDCDPKTPKLIFSSVYLRCQ